MCIRQRVYKAVLKCTGDIIADQGVEASECFPR